MNNKEVAHLWANQSRTSGKGSSYYFEGATIYSYGRHFPIARHYQGAVLFTTRTYSITTAKHILYTHSACNHLKVFHVDDVMANPGPRDLDNYAGRINAAFLNAAKSRKRADTMLDWAQRLVDEANEFSAHFKLRRKFKAPSNLEKLKAKADAIAKKERAARKAEAAKLELEQAEMIKEWLANKRSSLPRSVQKCYLRANLFQAIGQEYMRLETSKGAMVPLDDAQKAFRFAMIHRAKGWHRNGSQFQVGDYHLDAINKTGIVAGCHQITWDEVERFAKLQGWL